GPEAVAADPAAALRLAQLGPRAAALGGGRLRLLGTLGRAAPAAGAGGGPGAELAGGGRPRPPPAAGPPPPAPPPRPSAGRAAPAGWGEWRYARGALRARLRRHPHVPLPPDLVLVLDTPPPTFGPVEAVLRLAAHGVAMAAWAGGARPLLVTLDDPARLRELA